MDIQFAYPVLIIEALVFALIECRIDDTLLNQETAPEKIAVAGNQGVVEVKKRNTHPQSIHERSNHSDGVSRLLFAPGAQLWENVFNG